MNPLALMMSRGMQPPTPDYAMPGPAPDMRTAYAQMEAAKRGVPGGGTDSDIADFVHSLKPYVMNLPPPLQMKFSKLWELVESQALRAPTDPTDYESPTLFQRYGDSADIIQAQDGRKISRDGPPGSENWNEAQWDEWEEEQSAEMNRQLESILRGYGKGR